VGSGGGLFSPFLRRYNLGGALENGVREIIMDGCEVRKRRERWRKWHKYFSFLGR